MSVTPDINGWMPIETAPKGNGAILCFIPVPFRVLVLYWDDGDFSGEEGWRTNVVAFIRFKPTHWQPLPAPPVQS